MSRIKFLRQLIFTSITLFIMLCVFIAGSITANEMITSSELAIISGGFSLCLLTLIIELILIYAISKIWI